ncbi:MAG: MgtC/SapB family protein [Acidimicrobiaceae bacterium]|nr:MgtC/SapB family protein [Acidimicrobiaceae bacterium]
MSTSQLLAYVYALAIGLLLGGERERSHRSQQESAYGVRTFALLALMGTLSRELGGWVVLGVLFFLSLLLVASYRRTNREDPGTTTETSALATFLLGVLCYHDAALAAALGIVIAAVLISKERLHSFVRDVVSDVELVDVVKFLVVAFVVLPLLPDRGLGPYGVLNPERIWFIVVVLTGISWVGYIAVRLLGPRRGLFATGLASGFVSATAASATLGRISKNPSRFDAAVAGAQMASVATYLQLGFVLFVVSPKVASHLVPAIVAGSLSLLGATWLVFRSRASGAGANDLEAPPRVEHPFALLPALTLSGVLTAALLAARWGMAHLGTRGAVLVAGAAGLADAHGGSLSAATLFNQGQLNLPSTLAAVGAAVGANTLVKCVIAFVAGGRRFGWRFAIGVVPSIAAFLVTLTFTN